MRQILWLLQDNLPLAVAEAVALTDPVQASRIGNLLILDTSQPQAFKRLALTRATYEFLFFCHASQLLSCASNFDWNKHYNGSFKVELHHAHADSVVIELAERIWAKLKKPKVDIKKPKTRYEFFFANGHVVVGRFLGSVDASQFADRRPHLRPAMHPSGMQPRLARALVNLTGATKGTITDPFCGAGGFLIEAGLLGFKLIGSDIEADMIQKAKKNLAAFKLKAKLSVKDARKLKSADYVVTDLPYGRNTKGKELPKLYLAFLHKLKRTLKHRAVVVFPHFVDHRKLLKQAKLKVLGEFSSYVHATLSREIAVVEP
jgi:tRNA (guanine10-N2)-dimethyltransferase